MVDRRVMEKDAVALTGLRIKAARVLTSLNQECFAERFKFGYASVKNWELGRSIPRDDTVGKILDALHECGVQTTRDWLLFGLGSGPNHIGERDDSVNISSFRTESLDFGHEIAQFERTCVKNNIKPIVVSVADDLMQPFFFKDDIIGAESIELKTFISQHKPLAEYPVLVEVSPNVFQPRFLASGIDGIIKFWQTYQGCVVGELKHHWLGKIIWFRRHSSNSISQ
jgi:DNA-binding transcriptional regulator YiaG